MILQNSNYKCLFYIFNGFTYLFQVVFNYSQRLSSCLPRRFFPVHDFVFRGLESLWPIPIPQYIGLVGVYFYPSFARNAESIVACSMLAHIDYRDWSFCPLVAYLSDQRWTRYRPLYRNLRWKQLSLTDNIATHHSCWRHQLWNCSCRSYYKAIASCFASMLQNTGSSQYSLIQFCRHISRYFVQIQPDRVN